jgi:hypothetical protein
VGKLHEKQIIATLIWNHSTSIKNINRPQTATAEEDYDATQNDLGGSLNQRLPGGLPNAEGQSASDSGDSAGRARPHGHHEADV